MSKYRKKPVEIEAGRWWDAWAQALDNRRAAAREKAAA